jgi:hypothetical protein
MSEIVTLKLPGALVEQAKEIASLTHRRLEGVLLEWLDRGAAEMPIESLPDDQVLALCDLQLQPEQQEALSDLLFRNREEQLDNAETHRLNELMQVYRQGLVHKAKALKVAVERGLRSPLNDS